jgi:hypothetical protein
MVIFIIATAQGKQLREFFGLDVTSSAVVKLRRSRSRKARELGAPADVQQEAQAGEERPQKECSAQA